jgi:hypothetical protein
MPCGLDGDIQEFHGPAVWGLVLDEVRRSHMVRVIGDQLVLRDAHPLDLGLFGLY